MLKLALKKDDWLVQDDLLREQVLGLENRNISQGGSKAEQGNVN